MINESVRKSVQEEFKFNRISMASNAAINALFAILVATCLIPLVFVFIISFSSEQSLNEVGYRFIPAEWSIEAYQFILQSGSQIIKSYAVSIIVTIAGACIGLFLTSTYAYALSRKTFKLRKFFTYTMLITMFFNGGMVSSYMIVTKFLGLKNSLLALILPISVGAFNIIVLRTFFKTSVPDAVLESAKIDGASQIKTFVKIVLPISLPGIATIGLFLTLGYWNDWMRALLYIDKKELFPIQYLLMQIERNIQFIAQNADQMGAGFMDSVSALPTESSKMAIVMLVVIPIACTYPFFQKYFISGLTVGAVKE